MRTASKITSLLVTQLRILSRVNLNKIPSCCCAVCRFGSIVESARLLACNYMQLHITVPLLIRTDIVLAILHQHQPLRIAKCQGK